jgi:hypothetical protein
MKALLEKLEKLENFSLSNVKAFQNANSIFKSYISNFNLNNVFYKKEQNVQQEPEEKNLKFQGGEPNGSNVVEMEIDEPDEHSTNDSLDEMEIDNPREHPFNNNAFPCLRIFINVRKVANNVSSIEFDQFGPILVIETNGKYDFLGSNEEEMIRNIINKARQKIVIQELEGQSVFPVKGRTANDPINPIYYKETIDGDKEKLSLSYFDKHRNDLKKEYEPSLRPKFLQNFEKLVKSSES